MWEWDGGYQVWEDEEEEYSGQRQLELGGIGVMV